MDYNPPSLLEAHCALGPGLAAYRALRRRRAHSRLTRFLSCYSDDDYDDGGGGGGDSPPSLLPIPTSSLLSLGVSTLLAGPSPPRLCHAGGASLLLAGLVIILINSLPRIDFSDDIRPGGKEWCGVLAV